LGNRLENQSTEKYLINQVKVDPHSPGYFRAFGPLENTEAWYKLLM
jgi:putative endopeptidase